MPRELRLHLEDVVEASHGIREFAAGLNAAAFAADRRTALAVLRSLEIAGEIVKNLPPEMLAKVPDVPWQKLVRLRDLLAHAYHGADLAVIWRAVQDDIPVLEAAARRLADGYRSPP